MPNKPDKFGIKFWIEVNVKSMYILNAISYLGKDESRPSTQRLSDKVVMTLMEPFMGKGRNVTTDNFFKLFLPAKELKKKKTSLVGAMNKVRHKLPASAKCLQQRYSSKLMKAGDMATPTVYQCKPKKNNCVLSSLRRLCLLRLTNLRERNRKHWNFITRPNVMLTWLSNGQAVFSQSRHPSVARCCFLQHSGFGRHQCICAPKTKPANFVSRATKQYVASVPPWSFFNALRQHKHETFFNFMSCLCSFFPTKLFFYG